MTANDRQGVSARRAMDCVPVLGATSLDTARRGETNAGADRGLSAADCPAAHVPYPGACGHGMNTGAGSAHHGLARRGAPPESRPAAPRSHGLLRNAAAALFALASLAALMLGTVAPAQAAVLISNDGQTASSDLAPSSNAWATSFTTGSNTHGYDLTNVQLRLGTPSTSAYERSKFKVSIWSSTSAGRPNAKLHDLTTPASFSAGLVSFAATNVVLAGDTTYFVVLYQANGLRHPTVTRTDATAEDSGGASGWSIGDVRYYESVLTLRWSTAQSSGHTLKFKVNGTVRSTIIVPSAPQNLAATEGDGRVRLNWSAPAGVGSQAITRYEYRHAAGTSVPDATDWTAVPDSNDAGSSTADETTVMVMGLTNATAYAFEVRAVSGAGDGTKAGPLTATPAAAACALPDFGTRRSIWTGNVTVEQIFVGATTYSSGFWVAGSRTYGDLDEPEFTIDPNAHVIGTVWAVTGLNNTGNFQFGLMDGPLTTAETAVLRLHVCNTAYDFSNVTLVTGNYDSAIYIWDADIDWSLLSTRTLHLSLPANVEAPTITGVPALSEAGAAGVWAPGETAEVTLTFSEAVTVDTTGGTPSIGLDLGGTESRSATYLRGSGTTGLVFGYTLTDADGSHSALLVPIDSLVLNGGAIRSQASGADAALDHNGIASVALPPIPQGEIDAFTARFAGAPQSHDGSDTFTFELHFSEAPEGLSYTTVAGGLLEVTGATVTKARRLAAGSNLAWEVTVTPSQSGDIAIRLPARACAETNAVCAGGRALAKAVSATVRGVPFTASFSGVPAEHDGETAFEVRFHLSEEPTGLSYRTVQNGLFDVTGGSVEKASRLVAGKNNGWTLHIDPSGLGDVTVRVIGTTACNTAPGVCTPDGRKLAGGLQVAIGGPAVLSIPDAEVEEAEGAQLDFVVTLSKSRYTATTVDYATSDGTATAGSDYTSTSGTITFAPLETSKTVSVVVLDDSHDEGSETMTMTLSNPSGARLGDSTATGTINNTDAMPRAWMVRFGRTVGSQVVDALTQRLDGAGASHVTVAGINLIGAKGEEPTLTDDDPFGLPEWAKNAEREADAQALTADDILLRSAFHLSSAGDGAQWQGPAFTAWGRVATGGFEAEEDGVTMDGDVTTGLVGFDAEWEQALAGIMFSQSAGDGSYRQDTPHGNQVGAVESSLTGVYPYASLDLSARVSAWALAGVGSGELMLKREGHRDMPADISMRMGALGVKGRVLDATGPSGVALNVKSDAMWVATKSERTNEMVATEGDVTRLRLIVQGERVFEAGNGATFTPSAQVGLRHDGGDAETGTGVEVGAGLRYSAGALTIEGQARTLVAHEASGYKEWGASGAIRVTPSASGRGLTLSIAPAWGRTGSAADRLWSAHDTRALGADGEFEADARLAIDAGYGLGLRHGRGVLSPYAGLTLGDAGARTMRTGTRWQLSPDTVVTVEATRQASDASKPANELKLRVALRF